MRTDLSTSTFRPSGSRCARRGRAMRRGCWWCGRAARGETAVVRDLPDLLQPGDQLVVNDTRVIRGAPVGRRIGRGAGDAHRGDAASSGSTARAGGVREAGQAACGRRRRALRRRGQGLLPRPARRDASRQKGEGGEVTLAFAFHGPVLDQAIAERGDMPLPPYIASRRARRRAGPRRLSDHVRARRGIGRGADRGTAFHRRAGGAAAGARHRPARVTLHVGAGTFLPVKADDTEDHRMHAECGQRQRRDRGRAQRGAPRGRAHRGGRLDRAAAARKRRGAMMASSAVRGRDRDLHHAGLSLPRRRRDADQFPPAALDAVHAGGGVFRARHDERPTPTRSRRAIASTPTATPACCFAAKFSRSSSEIADALQLKRPRSAGRAR